MRPELEGINGLLRGRLSFISDIVVLARGTPASPTSPSSAATFSASPAGIGVARIAQLELVHEAQGGTSLVVNCNVIHSGVYPSVLVRMGMLKNRYNGEIRTWGPLLHHISREMPPSGRGSIHREPLGLRKQKGGPFVSILENGRVQTVMEA